MLFVPLPLFATLILAFVFGRFVISRDMTIGAHQLFAAVVGLSTVQSVLSVLRWGYDVQGVAVIIAGLAPVLPACAYLAYRALAGRNTRWDLWPLAVIALNWIVLLTVPALADAFILLTYLGFGALLLRLCWKGADQLSLSPINDGREIVAAMCLTGVALVASSLTDAYLIFDFVENDGRNAGMILTFVSTSFVLAIGISAMVGRATLNPEVDTGADADPPDVSPIDSDIVARLEALFDGDGLHRSEDLSLRRLSRKLGLSDRQVSNAINRVRAMSVSQFVNDFRIKDACTLLVTSDKTIIEVSLIAGFATKSNFNREFLRVTGKTPSRWRQDAAR